MASDSMTPELTSEECKGPSNEESQSIPSISTDKRSVSFDKVSIRNYERTLSDHPAVSSGPGLSLSWKYEERSAQSVDEFEISRSGSRKISYVDLLVSRIERERILREECGYARSQIAQCVRDVNAAKHNRRQTINNLPMQHCEENWQSFLRFISRCFCRHSSENDVKALWKEAEKSPSVCSPVGNEIDRSCGSVHSISSILKKSSKIDTVIRYPKKKEVLQSDKIDTEIHCPTKKELPVEPQSIDVSVSSVVSDITSVTTRTSRSSDLIRGDLSTRLSRKISPNRPGSRRGLPLRSSSVLKPRNIIAEEP